MSILWWLIIDILLVQKQFHNLQQKVWFLRKVYSKEYNLHYMIFSIFPNEEVSWEMKEVRTRDIHSPISLCSVFPTERSDCSLYEKSHRHFYWKQKAIVQISLVRTVVPNLFRNIPRFENLATSPFPPGQWLPVGRREALNGKNF